MPEQPATGPVSQSLLKVSVADDAIAKFGGAVSKKARHSAPPSISRPRDPRLVRMIRVIRVPLCMIGVIRVSLPMIRVIRVPLPMIRVIRIPLPMIRVIRVPLPMIRVIRVAFWCPQHIVTSPATCGRRPPFYLTRACLGLAQSLRTPLAPGGLRRPVPDDRILTGASRTFEEKT